jgi:hypothetical protein
MGGRSNVHRLFHWNYVRRSESHLEAHVSSWDIGHSMACKGRDRAAAAAVMAAEAIDEMVDTGTMGITAVKSVREHLAHHLIVLRFRSDRRLRLTLSRSMSGSCGLELVG